jgi:CHAT domain-containing protein/tetratricopeptide (TPR) repeat protein
MTRSVVALVLGVALAAGPRAVADDPQPRKLTPQQREQVADQWQRLMATASRLHRADQLEEAEKALTVALKAARLLYPKDDYPDGHKDLRLTLGNLATVLEEEGKPKEAEPFIKESLAIQRRLVKGDDPVTVASLDELGRVYGAQGKYADAEPLLHEAVDMQRRLVKGDHPTTAGLVRNLAFLLMEQGKCADAEPLYRDALAMWRRLVKPGHPDLLNCLEGLARVRRDRGAYAEAETLYREALDIRRQLARGDDPDVAVSLGNLASILRSEGKFGEAEKVVREALDMWDRLVKGDDPSKALCLGHLALVLRDQGNFAEAEALHRKSLDMNRRLYPKERFPNGHPYLAESLEGTAFVMCARPGKYEEAEALFREAIDMRRRLLPGDRPETAACLAGLGWVLGAEGKYAEAETVLRDTLRMRRRMFREGRPEVAESLDSLASVLQQQGKHGEAAELLKEALAIDRALLTRYAEDRSYGEALNLLASWPSTRDGYLSNELALKADAATVYPEVWSAKAALGRVVEQRHLAARAATDAKAAALLADLAAARRRRADLLFALAPADPASRKKRDDDLKGLTAAIVRLDRDLRPLLPAVDRAEKLAKATPADLQKALPADAAVVDYLRYTHFDHDPKKPGKAGEKQVVSYLAFVITKDALSWVDLGPAGAIQGAAADWYAAITGGKDVPPALPAKVRELAWAKVRKAIPDGVKVVYLCPDMALWTVPWAALPGDAPGTVLLEDYAVAVVPHAPFLLDKLWPDSPSRRPDDVLVVGGVAYDADVRAEARLVAGRAAPLLKPGQRVSWPDLAGTAAEAKGVAEAAARKKLTALTLDGRKADVPAVLAALPKARVAHLATHGFLADPSFRRAFEADPELFEMSRRGERVGAAALNPLVATGLVLAGANRPDTPGRGILTGEALVDLDLSGLELAVLSACETGTGDAARGEGILGLQRGFHMAGTRNVVASLWKVPDRPTAALMALFYRNLWQKDLPPVEALRQAQLEIYRNPGKIAELAEGFRGKFVEVPGSAEETAKPGSDGKAHPRQWAAFSFSGPGR